MNKRTWISLLICVNVALLTGIVLAATKPKSALAQATGLCGNYLAVCGQIQSQFDALYIIDMQTKHLHGFLWDKGRQQLEYASTRDLRADFRNDRQ